MKRNRQIPVCRGSDRRYVCVFLPRKVYVCVLLHMKETSFVYQGKRGSFLAFWAKNGQITVKSGFGAVDWRLRGPNFCFQRLKHPENAGVLFAFFCQQRRNIKV